MIGRWPREWGWDDAWETAWSAVPRGADRPGRVVEEHRDRYRIALSDGTVTGTLVGEVGRPTVGDWVSVRAGGPEETSWIVDVLARRTAFRRRAAGPGEGVQLVAANVDTVWIVHGLDTEPNLRRIERYATVGWESGAQPVAVLAKADLHDDAEGVRSVVAAVTPGVPVRIASVRTDGGLTELAPDLRPGQTVALLGPSGAGKSSLVNGLLGRDELPTEGVRPGDRKGRHTTTWRQLLRLESGALLLDTPGMRELGLGDVSEGLERAFADITELAAGCRYRDCAHDSEPGCAVKAAVAAGSLDPDRLNSFHKLRREAAWQSRRADPLAQEEETRRWKEIQKSLRLHPKCRNR